MLSPGLTLVMCETILNVKVLALRKEELITKIRTCLTAALKGLD